MGRNEGPLGFFHLGLIQVLGEPLTHRTTVRGWREMKPQSGVQTNVYASQWEESWGAGVCVCVCVGGGGGVGGVVVGGGGGVRHGNGSTVDWSGPGDIISRV